MPLKKLLFRPGVSREQTRYASEALGPVGSATQAVGGWYESEKIRFRSGTPEKIGGWVRISTRTFLGVCRSLWNWVTFNNANLVGVGTNEKFYIELGGNYNDITPYTSYTGANATGSIDGLTGTGSIGGTGTGSFGATGTGFVGAVVTGALGSTNTATIGFRCTASIATTTMAVTAVADGILGVGDIISGTNVVAGTTITALGTGSGGTGTYTVSTSQTVASTTITGTSSRLNVTAVASGTLFVGDSVTGTGVSPGTTITAFGTGTGGTGTYTLSIFQQIASSTLTTTSTQLNVTAVSVGRLNIGNVITGTGVASGTTITGFRTKFVGTASISTTTMTISAVTSGSVSVGDIIVGSGVVAGTAITALGTGTGGVGTYTVSISQTTASTTISTYSNAVGVYTVSAAQRVASTTLTSQSTDLNITAVTNGVYNIGDVVSGTGVTAGTTITGFATKFSGTASIGFQVSGSITGTTLNVTGIVGGIVSVGDTISGPGITAGTTISSLGSGSGGTGTYVVSVSQTVGFVTINGTSLVLNVTAAASGAIVVGDTLAGDGVTPNTRIATFTTGTGGIGRYTVNNAQQVLPRAVTTYSNAIGVYSISAAQNVASTTITTASNFLNLTAVAGGIFSIRDTLTGTGVTSGTTITALGTATGGVGSYVSSIAQTVSPTTISATSNVLNITAVSAGSIGVGHIVQGTGVTANTTVTALGTGTGGVGTYTVSQSQLVASTAITTTSTTLQITAVSFGAIAVGQTVSGSGVTGGTTITALGTGTGGVGTYTVSPAQRVASTALVTRTTVTFAATTGSPIITVTTPANTLITGSSVLFRNAVSLGGNITAAVLNREYVVTRLSSTSFTITASVNATASDTGNGGTSTIVAYELNPAPEIQIPLGGWGAGPWGAGPWGTGSTAVNGLRLWSQSNFGEDLIFSARDGGIYYWDATAGVTSRGVPLQSLAGASNVPTIQKFTFVSDISRFVFAFGCNDLTSSVQNPLLVRWSDQESAVDWTPDPLNQSGSVQFSKGSELITCLQTRQEIVVWTDSALYGMQYVGTPIVWSSQLLGDNISIISPNAAAQASGVVYWMGVDKFYKYDGRMQTLRCDLRRYIFSDINSSQADQVFSGTNEGFNEVWWFYCSAESVEIDKYVVYNYAEDIWYYGTMGRTAWLDSGLRSYPLAATYSNNLVDHEVGVDDLETGDPVPIVASISSSEFDIDDGHNFGFVWRVIPDLTFRGSSDEAEPQCTMTLIPLVNSGSGYTDPQSTAGTSSASIQRTASVPVEEFTGQVYIRVRGRQMIFKVESTQIGTTWQLGAPRIDIKSDGRRGN